MYFAFLETSLSKHVLVCISVVFCPISTDSRGTVWESTNAGETVSLPCSKDVEGIPFIATINKKGFVL